ncbi:MAG: glycosyl hydrolase [Gammaproteobacteria bacterium]|nr:glycosyl hydrolase [Gammaproteobacteria bacterium]
MNLTVRLSRETQRYLNSALALAVGFALLLPFSNSVLAQGSRFDGLEFRSIGPFRGGRSAAVTGVPGENNLYYMGATGGGVWETRDGGANWNNISDGYFGGSIGAVAVSEWDPNVIYVGGGEVTVRGNVSHGSGMWKSTDTGKTWKSIGLTDSHHIPRVRIHPRNPDLVYAAVMGHLHGPNEERGVFRSKDGGENWEKILYIDDEVGVVDLVMDPNNPRILYASSWRISRTPYTLSSGGEGSALWKSTDGGDTWENLSEKEGMPDGTLGIIGVTVSPANSERVWAIVENKNGGVFRSDDGGATWAKTNDDRNLRQRAWYYTRIYADSQDENRVYVLNVGFFTSTDGGTTFERVSTQPPHGDHHDLWIAPEDATRMIVADDGGGQISFDRGNSWSTYFNQPTAQFYRVTTDNHFPYRIYGAQQDNSTLRILHRSDGNSISERDWEPSAGGESGHLAPHPVNPNIVYGGSYGGLLERLNHGTNESRMVDVWPDNPMGYGAIDLRYRFQWNFPILISPHDPDVIYAAAQMLFRTRNEGQSWQQISPDLTRNDPSTMGKSGGPITKDDTSVEYYGTIFAIAESQHEAGVIWTGSDDGLIHISRDDGESWTDVTPKEMPEWMMINSIEISPFNPGGAYLAGTRYKSDDFRPYLYKTADYGKSWELITDGIKKEHFTRVVRADPGHEGILYAGTELGMYVSLDDGENWESFQLNLPITPVTDLTIKNDDLIVATQGRSFWLLDDLTPLHQLKPSWEEDVIQVFKPRPTYRMSGSAIPNPGNAGHNLPNGVIVQYYMDEGLPDTEINSTGKGADAIGNNNQQATLSLEFLTAGGESIRTFSTDAEEDADKITGTKAGFNRFVWDMRYPDAEGFDGLIMWAGNLTGPKVVPGTYQLRIRHANYNETRTFEILADPRISASQEDMQAQFDFLLVANQKLTETHQAIKRLRKIRNQIDTVVRPLEDRAGYESLKDRATFIKDELKSIEEALYQTQNESNQDPLNYPIRLNNKLASVNRLVNSGSFRPTDQSVAVRDGLISDIDAELAHLARVIEDELPRFNNLVREQAIPAIMLDDSN